MTPRSTRSLTTGVSSTAFFLLTFALSWLIWIPLVLSHFGIGPLHIPEGLSSIVRLLGVLMPATAAIILTAFTGGRHAVGALLRRLGIWRVSWRWWTAAALGYPLLLVVTAAFYNRFVGNPPVTPLQPAAGALLVVNLVFLLIATLGEEIGWRGVALPGLQAKRSPLMASAILGVLWGVWHLPFWLLLDTFDQFGVGYLALNLLLVPVTFYLTWLFNHTRASLLIPVAFHFTFNIINTVLLPVTLNVGAFGLFIGLSWIVLLLTFRHLGPPYNTQLDDQDPVI